MKKIFHIQLFPFTYVAFTTTSVDISMHSHFVLHFLSCLSKINIPLFLPLFRSLHRKNSSHARNRLQILVKLPSSNNNNPRADEIIFCPKSKINIHHLPNPIASIHPFCLSSPSREISCSSKRITRLR